MQHLAWLLLFGMVAAQAVDFAPPLKTYEEERAEEGRRRIGKVFWIRPREGSNVRIDLESPDRSVTVSSVTKIRVLGFDPKWGRHGRYRVAFDDGNQGYIEGLFIFHFSLGDSAASEIVE